MTRVSHGQLARVPEESGGREYSAVEVRAEQWSRRPQRSG